MKATMMETKRIYKDSVFRKLFSDKDKLIELFNAIEGTNYSNADEVKITTLEDVIFAGVQNDISFQIGNEFVVLNEHQSTLNPNMPFRFLVYIAELYNKMLDDEKMIYRNELCKIPTPKFYTFYNGTKAKESEWELRLSDAFGVIEDNDLKQLELVVKVFNVNYDKNHKILKKCQTLREYSYFIAAIRKNQDEKQMTRDEAIEAAIQECIEKDILKVFLRENAKEVFSVLNVQWNLDDALQVREQEGIEKGKLETALEMIKGKVDFAMIAKFTGLSMDKIHELAKQKMI